MGPWYLTYCERYHLRVINWYWSTRFVLAASFIKKFFCKLICRPFFKKFWCFVVFNNLQHSANCLNTAQYFSSFLTLKFDLSPIVIFFTPKNDLRPIVERGINRLLTQVATSPLPPKADTKVTWRATIKVNTNVISKPRIGIGGYKKEISLIPLIFSRTRDAFYK